MTNSQINLWGNMLRDHDMKELLNIEKNLKSKLDRNTHSTIQIRDVMVLQVDKDGLRLSGETNVVSEEPTKYVLERMTQHIKNMAEIATKHHIADNCMMVGDKVVMRPEAENNITRLSFSEFSFYPSTEKGPLTKLEFNELMNKLLDYAKILPPNLHLVLSSFPVVDAEGNVHNVASYIQCHGGSAEPTITNFAKAVPSDEDIVYPGTKNPYFTQGYRTNDFTNKLKRQVNKLVKQLEKVEDFQTSVIDLINITLSHCASNPSLSPGELVSQLEELRGAIKEGALTKEQGAGFAIELTKLEKSFREAVEEKEEKTLVSLKKQVEEMSLASMEWDHGWSYGGNVRCVTQGGVEFTTAVDICFDHTMGVAKRSHLKDIFIGMQSLGKIVDSKVDHLITSNTIHHYSDNIISSSFAHVDANPVKSGVFDSTTMRKQDPDEVYDVSAVFGVAACVHVAIPREIGKLRKETAALVDKHNELFIKVEALRIFNSQGQVSPDKINQKLRQYLGESAVKNFESGLSKNEIAQLRRLAQSEFKKEGVHIRSNSLGTVFFQVQDRLKDPAQLLQLLSQLFSESKAEAPGKQLIAKMMLNQVIEGCNNWNKVNPKTQKKVLDYMHHALLKNDQIDFSNSQQLNKIVVVLKKQLQEAVFEKTGWMACFYKSATKQYDICFDGRQGLSNARLNGSIATTEESSVVLSN